jgi:hypothetical protein
MTEIFVALFTQIQGSLPLKNRQPLSKSLRTHHSLSIQNSVTSTLHTMFLNNPRIDNPNTFKDKVLCLLSAIFWLRCNFVTDCVVPAYCSVLFTFRGTVQIWMLVTWKCQGWTSDWKWQGGSIWKMSVSVEVAGMLYMKDERVCGSGRDAVYEGWTCVWKWQECNIWRMSVECGSGRDAVYEGWAWVWKWQECSIWRMSVSVEVAGMQYMKDERVCGSGRDAAYEGWTWV